MTTAHALRALVAALTLGLVAGCGQKTKELRLAPPMPGISQAGAGRTIALAPFEDARPADWAGTKVSQWIPGGGEKYKVTHVIARPVADFVRELTGEVLEKGGFGVLRVADASTAKAPVIIGRVEELRTEFTSGPMMGQIASRIRLTLRVESAGKKVLQKPFAVDHMRHAGNLEPEAFERVTDEALGKLLIDVALFLDSPEFAMAVGARP